MDGLSSPLNPSSSRLLEPRELSTSNSFSSISSASSLQPHYQNHILSSPCSAASPALKGRMLGGDDDENDELGSDVEKSFGEAMCVVDTPGPLVGQSVPSGDKTEVRPAPAQSRSPRGRVSSLRRGTARQGGSGSMMAMPPPQVFPPPLMSMASPTSEEDDYLSLAAELSPTAQRRPSGVRARRPDPVPIQAPSFGLRTNDEGVIASNNSLRPNDGLFASFATVRTTSSSSTSSSSSGLTFNTRPRAFGRESSRPNLGTSRKSNLASWQTKTSSRPLGFAGPSGGKGLMLPPPVPELQNGSTIGKKGSGGKRARSALPSEWTGSHSQESSVMDEIDEREQQRSRMGPSQSEPVFTIEPADILGSAAVRRTRQNPDSMDIDSPYRRPSAAAATSSSALAQTFSFNSPASRRRATEGSQPSGSPDLGSFFCDSPSAPQLGGGVFGGATSGRLDVHRRTSSPASPLDSPSTSRPPSIASRTFEKTVSTAVGGLFGAGGRAMGSRRTQPYKRPMLGPLASCSTSEVPRVFSTASAFPVLENGGQAGANDFVAPMPPSMVGRGPKAPMRRAFSVCDQKAGPASTSGSDPSDPDSMDASPCAGARVVSHFDVGSSAMGKTASTSGFRTVGHSASVGVGLAPSENNGGMLGFGENEKDGKILPCHRVKEDGLVRITHDTLRSVLSGEYADRIQSYHIIDCRFPYEFDGGHIEGAINVNTDMMVEELLLRPGGGLYSEGGDFPQPSRSGVQETGKPVVVIFHCEFSNKRAPTFAKHLRSKDRTLNNQHYPKVYYPELYILEGGYCHFYKTNSDKCDPSGYIAMDDPRHSQRCDDHLHHFRGSFQRTRSYTFGEGQANLNFPAPGSAPPLAFAPNASLANERRESREVIHEEEDVHMASPRPASGPSSFDSPNDSLDGSPCARVLGGTTGGPLFTRDSGPAIFGSTKIRSNIGRTLGRAAFSRVSSYAGTTQKQPR